jgi:ribosomal-protein-alanine N-acetyltransferase
MTRDHRPVPLRLPIETPRLLLRLPTEADVPDLRRSFRDPRTARAVGASLHSNAERKNPSEMVTRTRREFRSGEHLSLSVVSRESKQCIGRVGLRGLDWTWRKVESLSYWIDPRCWNQGYATEAAWFLCQAGFDELGMRRIASQALASNLASRAVLRRLGFWEEGCERESVVVRGRKMDMILFGMLRGELRPWAAVGPSGANSRDPSIPAPNGRSSARVRRVGSETGRNPRRRRQPSE